MRPLRRPMFRTGGPIGEGVMHGMNGLQNGGTVRHMNGFANGGRTGFVNAGEVYKNVEKVSTPPVKKKSGIVNTKKGYQFSETPASKALTGFTHYGPYSAMAGIYDLGAVPINTLSRMFGYNPGFSGTKFMDTLTGGAYSKRTGYDPDKAYFIAPTSAKKGWTIPSMKKDGDNKQIQALQAQIAELNKKKEKKEKTPAEIKVDKENQLNKIYNLLGVDRAKSNAASKALIDMSRYIDEGGKDVISKKNLGSTISKAIGAFDKRLDKVDQLKEAAGLMMAKGIVEKDIRSADNELKELTKQKYYKELHPKFSELKITAAKTMPGQKGYNSAAAAASDNYRGNIITQSDFSDIIEDIKEKSGELDETIIITNWTNEKIKEKNLADGDYTVGDALVTIIEGKVDSVAR
jgi:hypothetical protein